MTTATEPLVTAPCAECDELTLRVLRGRTFIALDYDPVPYGLFRIDHAGKLHRRSVGDAFRNRHDPNSYGYALHECTPEPAPSRGSPD